MKSKMTIKNPRMLQNSVSHQIGSTKTSGPLEFESQCLQDFTEEVQQNSKKRAKSKQKEVKRVKGSTSYEVFRATYEKRKTQLG